MSGWMIVALVAIVVSGIVQIARARAGIVADQHGNERLGHGKDPADRAELEAARRELEDLRERVRVLERIATDAHTGEAREQARIAAEIEALRDAPALKREQSE